MLASEKLEKQNTMEENDAVVSAAPSDMMQQRHAYENMQDDGFDVVRDGIENTKAKMQWLRAQDPRDAAVFFLCRNNNNKVFKRATIKSVGIKWKKRK